MQDIRYFHAFQCVRAESINTYVLAAYECIILDNVAATGITNFGLDVLNLSDTGSITTVYVYGSFDGQNYYKTENDIYTVPIGPGDIKHVEFDIVTAYVRVTVETDQDLLLSACLHGNIT